MTSPTLNTGKQKELYDGVHALEDLLLAQDFEGICTELPAIIGDILKDPAPRCRINAAGFMYVMLSYEPIRAGSSLRLHLWPDDIQRLRPLPHSHSVDIDSAILCGAIEDTRFEVDFSDDGEFAFMGFACSPNDSRPCDDRRTGACRAASARHLKSGDFYSVRAPHYHSTLIDDTSFTCTLARFSNFSDDPSRLVYSRDAHQTSGHKIASPQPIRLQDVAIQDVHRRLNRLRSEVSNLRKSA